jgi:hypothetical protein
MQWSISFPEWRSDYEMREETAEDEKVEEEGDKTGVREEGCEQSPDLKAVYCFQQEIGEEVDEF